MSTNPPRGQTFREPSFGSMGLWVAEPCHLWVLWVEQEARPWSREGLTKPTPNSKTTATDTYTIFYSSTQGPWVFPGFFSKLFWVFFPGYFVVWYQPWNTSHSAAVLVTWATGTATLATARLSVHTKTLQESQVMVRLHDGRTMAVTEAQYRK